MSSQRLYVLSFVVQSVLAMVFLDHVDGFVFLEVGYNVLVLGTPLYVDTGLHGIFNYFPAAFIPVLAGQYFYYLMGLENLMLARLFLKIPIVLGNLYLARLVSSYCNAKGMEERLILHIETILLFNPLSLYVGVIKGQFDVFVAICLVKCWWTFQDGQMSRAGFWGGLAFMLKVYGAFLPYFVGISLLKDNIRQFFLFVSGVLTSLAIFLVPILFTEFDGLIQHAVLFHLDRHPNGFSIPAYLYYSADFLFSDSVFEAATLVIVWTSTLILVFCLAYLTFHVLQEDTNDHLLLITLKFFLVFFVLNKVFWLQYALSPLTLFFLLDRDWKAEELRQWGHWAIILSPVSVLFRLIHMVPPDVREFVGPFWVEVMWLSFVSIHLLLVYLYRQRIDWTPKNRRVYLFFLIALPIHFALMVLNAP